jgi:hypothetical protein
MPDRNLDCRIDVPDAFDSVPLVNAFRAVQDGSGDWMLDFLILSDKACKASVMARVRVGPEFMAAIRDRLASTLRYVGDDVLMLPAGSGSTEVN